MFFPVEAGSLLAGSPARAGRFLRGARQAKGRVWPGGLPAAARPVPPMVGSVTPGDGPRPRPCQNVHGLIDLGDRAAGWRGHCAGGRAGRSALVVAPPAAMTDRTGGKQTSPEDAGMNPANVSRSPCCLMSSQQPGRWIGNGRSRPDSDGPKRAPTGGSAIPAVLLPVPRASPPLAAASSHAPAPNARSDTVARSGMFKAAFAERRCLVPATAYYEWRDDVRRPPGPSSGRCRRRDLRPERASPNYTVHPSDMPCDGPERVRLSVASPFHPGLPRISGGSASMTSLPHCRLLAS